MHPTATPSISALTEREVVASLEQVAALPAADSDEWAQAVEQLVSALECRLVTLQ